ncbi:response regulator [Pseudoxanthomonas sp. USHLN014]|uniref:response regulator n=1 Tax=Pseudoxanthomonas sp. USHLN014 TaxID=3081297 RepID=UPI00301D45D4
MSKPLRILFVEDQADLRELMSDVFVQMGMEVVTLADAAAALELLAEGPQVDVLFTDVYMPGQMSGAELSMRVAQRWPQVRIVLASGHARHQLPELPPGVQFIQKPYSLQQAARLIRGEAPSNQAA